MPIKINYFLLLVFFIISLSINAQNVLDQEIDFSIEALDIPDALKSLSSQTGIPFSFSSKFFITNKKLSLSFSNESIEKILQTLLVNQSVAFKAQGNRILFFKTKSKKQTISGYLEDAASGERLIAATIFSPEHSQGTTSNEYGFFSITLPVGPMTLTASYLGFAPQTLKYDLNKNIQVNIQLATGFNLPEVIIKPALIVPEKQVEEHDAYFIDKKESEVIPGIGGEADLLRSAQLLPGIQAPNDGLGGLNVRGGSNGQNLLLLDGVPVYIPYHLLGIYSIYNNRTVNSAKVLKGNFPARYGGRLSSVFDVRTREGNKYEYKAEAGVSLTSTKALIEGPLVKEKGSFLFAGRTSHSGFLLDPSLSELYFQTNEGSLETKFFDLNLKLNYTFSQKDRLFLSLFSGGDEFSKSESETEEEESKRESEFELYWANTIGSLRWNHLFSDNLFLNTTLTYSWFDYEQTSFSSEKFNNTQLSDEVVFFDSRSENQDIALKFDFNWLPTTSNNIRFGSSFSKKAFSPEVTFFNEEDDELIDLEQIDISALQALVTAEQESVSEVIVYAEDELKFAKNIHANLGFRQTSFFTEDRNYFSIEPWFSIHFHPDEKLHIKFATGQMKQFLHLISNSAFSLPNDLWTPSSVDILPQSSWQSEIGFTFSPIKKIQLQIEAYYKRMDNLYAYPDNFSFLDQVNESDIDQFLTSGSGEAFGLEGMLNYSDKTNGAKISLSVSKTRRQYEDQNLGLSYPFEYDFPIQSNVFLYRKFGNNFQASLQWTYQSANPIFQFEVQSLSGIDPTLFNPIGQKNRTRGIDYHRLDVQITYSQDFNGYSHKFSLGANNLYNRQNAAYFELASSGQPDPIFSLPFLPSFNYALRFQKSKPVNN